MAKHVLLTRPNHDVITSYLHAFSASILKNKNRTVHITDLEGEQVNRKEVEDVLKSRPTLVLFNGHGDTARVAGFKDEIIFDEKNVHLTKNAIVYALACSSLKDLGRMAIQKGTKAYVGYRESFMIVRDPTRENTPLKDRNAMPFKKACSLLSECLIAGIPVSQAVEKTCQEYTHQIMSYGTSEDDPYGDVPLIRFALTWNLECLGMEGDPEAAF